MPMQTDTAGASRRLFMNALGTVAGWLCASPALSSSAFYEPTAQAATTARTYKMSKEGALYRLAEDGMAWEKLAVFERGTRLLKIHHSAADSTTLYLLKDDHMFWLHSDDGRRWHSHTHFRRAIRQRSPVQA